MSSIEPSKIAYLGSKVFYDKILNINNSANSIFIGFPAKSLSEKIDVAYFVNFIETLRASLASIFRSQFTVDTDFNKTVEPSKNAIAYSTMVSLTSRPFVGGLILKFTEELLLNMTKHLFQTDLPNPDDLPEVACEVLNWVVGNAKKILESKGFDIFSHNPPEISSQEFIGKYASCFSEIEVVLTEMGEMQFQVFARQPES